MAEASTEAQAPEKMRSPSPFSSIPFTKKPRELKVGYLQDLRIFQSAFTRFWMVVLLVSLVALPFALTDFWISVFNFTAIASLGAIGLNLLTGFTGQVSLGHAFFIGLGAYTAGYLGGDLEMPVIVWLPAAGVLGALVGLIIGPFALRLKGLYLAIVTLGLVFLGEHLFLNLRFITGGPQGRSTPGPVIGALNFADLSTIGLP
ncbi:MAG: branched-chain amino acid ABC transporter permease, partial [Acidimicrobiia bacterium]